MMFVIDAVQKDIHFTCLWTWSVVS